VGVKKLTTPLTLTLSRKWRGKKRKGFNGTLTFILSRKGRERGKNRLITFVLSRRRREKIKRILFNQKHLFCLN
jgi:hypothetical protein